jgi:hypothetical protein
MVGRSGVGTLGEKPLHAALKRWYAAPGDLVEHPVDAFVIDLVRGEQLIEIQTRSFSSMRRKLATLLDLGHPVHVVHPVACETMLVKVDDAGEVTRRRSPRRGDVVDLFAELVSLAPLLARAGLTFEVVLVRQEELRRFDGQRAWRRRGWVVEERRLVEVLDRVALGSPDDLAALLPAGLPDEFTTADLAACLGRPRRLAQQMTYCLRHAGVVDIVGKQGNAIVHRRSAADRSGVRS